VERPGVSTAFKKTYGCKKMLNGKYSAKTAYDGFSLGTVSADYAK
jgi:hypothetical protein